MNREEIEEMREIKKVNRKDPETKNEQRNSIW